MILKVKVLFVTQVQKQKEENKQKLFFNLSTF